MPDASFLDGPVFMYVAMHHGKVYLAPYGTPLDSWPSPAWVEIDDPGPRLHAAATMHEQVRYAVQDKQREQPPEPPLIDPDCQAGKHQRPEGGGCVGGQCQCDCHD
jgi:hypothetical protein